MQSIQKLTVALFALLLTVCASIASAAPVVAPGAEQTAPLPLAKNGQAQQPIIIAANASDQIKASATELQGYLRRITGAEFEVREGDGQSGIVLGTLQQFPQPGLEKPLELRGRFDGVEAFAIRTEKSKVLLIGRTDTGVAHAVAQFLELLGYRHFFPSPEWEVVPPQSTLTFGWNVTDRPAILTRRIWYGYGFFDRASKRAQNDYLAWSRHNRMAHSFTVSAGHAWQNLITRYPEEFKAHPEYLALVKSKDGEMVRKGPQLCPSQPGLRELATRYALEAFEKNPDADMVSMEPADGGGHCQCELCTRQGKVSNRVFALANYVARALQKSLPGKMVGLYAYNEHSEPPDFELEPNVYVQLTAGFTRGQYSFAQLLDLWPQKARNMGYYEYFSVWLWDFDRLPGGRAADIPALKTRIADYAARNATSLDAESGNNWGVHGRGYYIANRLMWNPQADTEALLADFYDKAFGPAAPAMKRYYERIAPTEGLLMSRHLLGLAFRDVQEASILAKDNAAIQARLDDIKSYLHYVYLRWQIDRLSSKVPAEKEEKKALTLAALTHVYRTRWNYMNHWEAMRQSWTPRAAEEFDEPSWSGKAKLAKGEKHPWAVDEAYTRAEIEKNFRAGLDYFQPQEIVEQSFSNDLLPVSFANAKPVATNQKYQGGLSYLLYSRNGEPLQVTVTTGTIAGYRDRADARYSFRQDEKVLSEGTLPLDGEMHTLSATVPGPGIYHFNFNDSSAGWKIEAAADTIVSLPLQRGHGYRHAGWMQQMYFYVPKGTRKLVYYWSGNDHRVHGPDGKVVQEIKESGDFVQVPVPAGDDGKVWSFSRMALGNLWFFNAPNYLSASPAAMLLPREVVQKDGLEVIH